MSDELIAHIRSRIDRCRYLASMINDERTAQILRQMADEGEADVRRLEAQGPSECDE
jgi:hypothetical protein